jgi:hypothetical protein
MLKVSEAENNNNNAALTAAQPEPSLLDRYEKLTSGQKLTVRKKWKELFGNNCINSNITFYRKIKREVKLRRIEELFFLQYMP